MLVVAMCASVLAALAGCGSQSPSLSPADAGALEHAISSARASAAKGERSATLTELAGLRDRIERLGAGGRLPERELAVLRRGVAQAIAAARRELPPPAPAPPAPAAATNPAPTPPAKPRKHDEDGKGGKGGKEHKHGHDGGHGGEGGSED